MAKRGDPRTCLTYIVNIQTDMINCSVDLLSLFPVGLWPSLLQEELLLQIKCSFHMKGNMNNDYCLFLKLLNYFQ